jgi:ferritin-like protein
MAESQLHEPAESLSAETREMHRAIASLIEELEAVDWYAQRVDASADEALARVLAHNRDEEKEHACMTLEWIRRHDPGFDAYLRKFLFTSGPIVEAEHGGGNGRAQPTLELGSLREDEPAGAPPRPREEETAP